MAMSSSLVDSAIFAAELAATTNRGQNPAMCFIVLLRGSLSHHAKQNPAEAHSANRLYNLLGQVMTAQNALDARKIEEGVNRG